MQVSHRAVRRVPGSWAPPRGRAVPEEQGSGQVIKSGPLQRRKRRTKLTHLHAAWLCVQTREPGSRSWDTSQSTASPSTGSM